MTRLSIFVSALLLVALGCDGLPGRPDPADRYQRPDEITDFDALYAVNCSGCHGEGGQSGPATPLGDPVYAALAEPAYLEQVIAVGVPGTPMPFFATENGGTLTDEQVSILVRGLKARGVAADLGPAPVPALVASKSQLEQAELGRGERAYGEFCARCHGVGGSGGESAGSIVEPAYLGLVSDQALRTAVMAGRNDLGMPGWLKVGRRPMAPQEIGDVVAWLASKRPATAASSRVRDGK